MDDSDNSMNSSIEASNGVNDKCKHIPKIILTNPSIPCPDRSNKINQLREHINQLFLSNPELIGSIKFQKLEDEKLNANHLLSNLPDPLSFDHNDHHYDPKKQGYLSPDDTPPEGEEHKKKGKNTGKLWEAISREMTREHKGSKVPTIKRINNVLNIFKATIEKPEQKYDVIEIKPPPRSLSLNAADAKIGKDKKGKGHEGQAKERMKKGTVGRRQGIKMSQ